MAEVTTTVGAGIKVTAVAARSTKVADTVSKKKRVGTEAGTATEEVAVRSISRAEAMLGSRVVEVDMGVEM